MQDMIGGESLEREPGTDPNDAIPRYSILDWVAETDENIGDTLKAILASQPDRTASEEEQLRFTIELAVLNGKKELLDEASLKLAAYQENHEQDQSQQYQQVVQPQLPFNQES